MKEIMKKLDQQNWTAVDCQTIIKIIQAALQRGSIRAEECTTVGRMYEKLNFTMQKLNKENEDAGLSKTDN